jgi:hypothetical protein
MRAKHLVEQTGVKARERNAVAPTRKLRRERVSNARNIGRRIVSMRSALLSSQTSLPSPPFVPEGYDRRNVNAARARAM